MNQAVLSLTDSTTQDPALSGSKGANLARMASAGLLVPRFFVVTTDVFTKATAGVMPAITENLSLASETDMVSLQKASDSAQGLILDLKLPDDAIAEIWSAYETLGQGTVSVRSSATAEDLAEASFAGQYDSYLNVMSLDSMLENLLKVWASLYSPNAIAYRIRNNIPHTDARMAVVVQEQLHAEASGVMFTQDPVTGAEQFVINSTLGLGEGVVAGIASPDQFTLDAESGKLISSDIATKDTMVIGSEHGGTTQVAVPDDKRQQPSLSEAHLDTLVTHGKHLVDLFGGPQDIEFAVLDGTVYLLQARPVTTNESSPESEVPWEEGMDTSYGWILNHLSSRGPLYRLQQYAFHFYLEGQRRCFEETGSGRNRNHIGHFTNGYVYARPPNDIDEKVVEERQARHTARWDSCAGQGTSYYESVQKPIIEERLAELKHLRPRKDDLPKLVGYMEACMKNWGYVSGHLHWCMNKSGPTPDWPATYHEITGEPSVNSSVFVQAIPNSTTHLVKRLQKLARIVQSDPELSTAFARNDYGILENPDYQQRPAAQSFKKSFRSLLSIHGQRTGWSFGSSAGITTPTWNMEPERALDMIASYAEQDLDRLEQLEADARRERKTAVRRTRRRFSDTPDLLKRFEMGRLAAIGQVKQMENHNHMMEQRTTGTMREAIHFVGEALVAKRLIDDPDDVLHLSFDELGEVAKGSGLDDLRTLVRERAKERENRSRFSPPPTLGDGPIPENPFGRMGELPSGVGLHGNTLQGVAASRGRQTGPARLVLPGKPRPNIRPGDVLVAGNVGQEWTPVMSVLGGLVLDQGAVFQHAALVAREYRIPAVLMTKEATSVIKEGQTITVDGDNGVVELDG